MLTERRLVLDGGGHGVLKDTIQSLDGTVENHEFLVVLKVYDHDSVSLWQDV
jgi:hypothetical protein